MADQTMTENPIAITKHLVRETDPDFVASHGRLIAAGYKGQNPEDHPHISPEQALQETKGAGKAEWVISARDTRTGEPIALLAYSLLTPATAPEFYDFLANEHTSEEVQQFLANIAGVFITHEMVVSPAHRRNGVSSGMRQKALSDFEGRIAFAGQIQHASSAAQRLRMENAMTIWAGIIQNENPTIAPRGVFIPAADSLSRAFLNHQHPGELATYRDGLIRSHEFDTPARMPTNQNFDPPLLTAMRKIVNAQEEATRAFNEDQTGHAYGEPIIAGTAITVADRRRLAA